MLHPVTTVLDCFRITNAIAHALVKHCHLNTMGAVLVNLNNIFECTFMIKSISYSISLKKLKLIPKGPNDNRSGLIYVLSWHIAAHIMTSSIFFALLAICARNSPVTGEFPAQRPVTRSFDVFFDLRLNKRLSKQWWGWWFETPSRPLWRHCNAGDKLVPWRIVSELM